MPETKFRVGMTCEGCSNAVKRILGETVLCISPLCPTYAVPARVMSTSHSHHPLNRATCSPGKIEGVEGIQTDVAAKTVVVTGTAAEGKMLEALQKWGAAASKTVELM